jgi:hypothetical protein
MKRAFAVVALAACSGGSSGSDAMPDGNELRPDSDGDLDHDGIPDVSDNCPQSVNVGQLNEDGDRFGDACDPCPVVADDAPPDADDDGVADACDPLPNMFGDQIRYFEGFHAAVPSGWEEIGTWTFSGDGVTSSSASASLAVIATDRTRETVSASFTVVTAGASASAGVIDNKQVAGVPAVGCAVTGVPELSVYATTELGNAVTTPYEMSAGTRYTVRLRRDMSSYTCSASGGASASVMKNVTIANAPYLSGITSVNAAVRFHWFMVVESL